MTTIQRQVGEHFADRIDSPAELARQRRGLRRGRLAFAVAVGCALGFALLLLLVLLGDPRAFDLRVTLALQRLRPPGLEGLMLAVSWVGFRPQWPLIAACVAAGLLWRGLRLEAAFALLAFGAALLNGVKELVGRPRPSADLDGVAVFAQERRAGRRAWRRGLRLLRRGTCRSRSLRRFRSRAGRPDLWTWRFRRLRRFHVQHLHLIERVLDRCLRLIRNQGQHVASGVDGLLGLGGVLCLFDAQLLAREIDERCNRLNDHVLRLDLLQGIKKLLLGRLAAHVATSSAA